MALFWSACDLANICEPDGRIAHSGLSLNRYSRVGTARNQCTTMAMAFEIKGLTKSYGQHVALDAIRKTLQENSLPVRA